MSFMKTICVGGLLCLLSSVAQAGESLIVAVEASVASANGTRNFHVSVLHNDQGWDHYADRFEILTDKGEVISTRVLAHPHVNEQPFTREKYGVKIPQGLMRIYVRAHDKIHGYGPKVMITLPKNDEKITFKLAN